MTTPREQLAAALKQARIEAGHKTHAGFAKVLHMDRSVVTRAESLNQPAPSDAVLAAWIKATGADPDDLMDLAERVRSGAPEWAIEYLSAELVATLIRCWAPLVVPGLFQTQNYARALLSVEHYSPERLDELVKARMERQQVLNRAHVVAVVAARVLDECIGSPKIMAEQCAHLVAIAEHPHVSLHVVPEGRKVGTWGGLEVASGEAGIAVGLVAFEDVTDTTPEMADKAVRAFERILSYAMPPDESLDYLRTLEEKWEQQV